MRPISCTMISRLNSGCPRQLRVIWQNKRCSILFHLLVPGGKWQTLTFKTGFVGESLQRHLPQTRSCSVAAAAVRGNQQAGGMGKPFCAHRAPPTANRGDGELGRVVVDANADPRFIVRQVIHAIRDQPCPSRRPESRGFALPEAGLAAAIPGRHCGNPPPIPSSSCPRKSPVGRDVGTLSLAG